MPDANIEVSLQQRIQAFRPVVEAIIEEPISYDDLVGLVVARGLKAMLADIIGSADREILLESIHQMAEDNPQFVYSFTEARLRDGASVREEAKRQIGFVKPGTGQSKKED